jgi:undecaprenyl diphosphate synthase
MNKIANPDCPLEIYSAEDIDLLDPNKIPGHIAIIMDGNRRWARQAGVSPMMGHWEGAEVLTDIVRAASEIGVKTLTVFAFSTENWARSEEEIEALMNLFELYLIRKREPMVQDGIRLDAIGRLSDLPENIQRALDDSRKATQHCSKINLVLALNYGGRDEIRRALGKILKLHEERKLAPEDLTEELISSYLDTSPWGDPDLLIRTSGEVRISNFLLWQISYSEIYITDVLWPHFTPKKLLEAVITYQNRKRRGGI